MYRSVCIHCKNKLVVSTTEWLPWLQTNWKDSGYGMFALLLETNCIRQPKGQLPRLSYNHSNYTDNPHNICASLTWLQVPYCNSEVHL